MTLDAWISLAVTFLTVIAMAAELVAVEVVVIAALTSLMLAGVLTPDEAISGFGSIAVLAVAALYVVAEGVRRTGVLTVVADKILGEQQGSVPLVRMMIPAGFVSAFMNNTPIVAMFAPAILDWCKRNDVAPSRMLMPLSFATILGGMCTLIGTSATLLVDDLMRDAGMRGLGMFEIAWVGFPVAVVGLIVIGLISSRVLPLRRDPMTGLRADRREFLVEMLVEETSSLVGRTIEDAGLRNLGDLFLMNIERGGRFLGPVTPSEILLAADRLVFVGIASQVVALRRFNGLVPAEDVHYHPGAPDRRDRVFEVVIAPSSPLVGSTVKDVGFRGRYDAVILAVHRAGQRMIKRLSEVELRAGDTLMVEADKGFEARWGDAMDFALISRVQAEPVGSPRGARGALLIVACLVVVVATDRVSLVVAAFAAATSTILIGLLSARRARRAIDLQVLMAIGGAMGIGRALEISGAADTLGAVLLSLGSALGAVGALGALFVYTSLLSTFISNVAAAAIAFPIALSIAEQGGFDPRPFAVVIAIAASASFATPTGYQTNLMVYGPGGYRFSDFARLGLPVQLSVMIVALLVVPQVWPL